MLMAYEKQMMVIKCGSVSFYFVLEMSYYNQKVIKSSLLFAFIHLCCKVLRMVVLPA